MEQLCPAVLLMSRTMKIRKLKLFYFQKNARYQAKELCRDIFLGNLSLKEGKNSVGLPVLILEFWWRHVKTKNCQITLLLFSLHWLPVKFQIVFKILLITFKALKGLAPLYIAPLISIKSPSQYHLWSSCDSLLLSHPSLLSKVTLGDRSFAYAAPKLWNALPFDLRSEDTVAGFKSKLKTHLFWKAFS